ncbi:MAG: hypothetical protein PWQ77_2066 [Kosmotogales bacterium]|nr:hypothetical protein [Kosmotogales bacterium]
MKNKKFITLLIVTLLVSVTFILKTTFKDDITQVPTGPEIENLEKLYAKINESPKPSIIVFSYDVWCCDETHELFEDYNLRVLRLLKDYDNDYETLFVNTKMLNAQSKDFLEDISIEYIMFQFPSILIRDSSGELIYLEEEMNFDEETLRKRLDGIEND